MALQSPTIHMPVRPARRPASTEQAAAPVALHPALLLREVAGDSADTRTLRVRGAGMPDALLEAGDMILLQGSALPAEGELFAVQLPGHSQPSLRRLHFEGEQIRLQPESSRYPAEVLPADRVVLMGRVVAIMRQPR